MILMEISLAGSNNFKVDIEENISTKNVIIGLVYAL